MRGPPPSAGVPSRAAHVASREGPLWQNPLAGRVAADQGGISAGRIGSWFYFNLIFSIHSTIAIHIV